MPCLCRRIVWGGGKQLVAVRHVGSEQELCTLALVRDGGSCILSASSSSCVVVVIIVSSSSSSSLKLDLVYCFVQIGFNECLFV